MTEMWLDIPSLPGRYQASDLGQVRSIPAVLIRSNGRKVTVAGKVLRPRKNSNGYFGVSVGGGKTRPVHQLVAEAFLGPRPEGCTDVNHKDGNKLNNTVQNLEWASRSENVLHAIHVLGRKIGGKGVPRGEEFSRRLSKRNSCRYRVRGPDGSVTEVTNLKDFCKTNSLPYTVLMNVYHGHIKSTSLSKWQIIERVEK